MKTWKPTTIVGTIFNRNNLLIVTGFAQMGGQGFFSTYGGNAAIGFKARYVGLNRKVRRELSTLSACIPQDILQFGEQLQKTKPFVGCEISTLLAYQHA